MRKTRLFGEVLRKTENVVSRRIDGETVLLNLATNIYYSIDEVGTFLWEKMDGRKAINDIVNEMCVEYEVGEEELEGCIKAFINDLKKEKLVEIKK